MQRVFIVLQTALFYSAFSSTLPTKVSASVEENEKVHQLEEYLAYSEPEAKSNYSLGKEIEGLRGDALLKDTASTITVIDEALIDDLKIETIGELSQVVANLEVVNDRTEFTGNPSVRIRGLAIEEQLFDLFPRSLPFSLSNTKRVEIISGSDSVLIGQSESGGKINVNSKKADLQRDRIEIDLSAGNFKRQALLDTNQRINEKLAITLLGELTRVTAEQDLSIRDQEGASVHFAYTPTFKTQFGFLTEIINQETVRAPRGFSIGREILDQTGLLYERADPDWLDLAPQGLIEEILKENMAGFSSEKELEDYLRSIYIPPDKADILYNKDAKNEIRGNLQILDVTHNFTDSLRGTLAYFHEKARTDSRNLRGADSFVSGDINNPEAELSWERRSEDNETHSIRATLDWKKEFDYSSHQILLGLDLDRIESESHQDSLYNQSTDPDDPTGGGLATETVAFNDFASFDSSFSRFDPNNTVNNTVWIQDRTSESVFNNLSLWGGLQSKFGNRLHTFGGIRLHHVETEFLFEQDGEMSLNENTVREASPSVGAVFWITEHISVTGSWSRALRSELSERVDPAGEALPSEIGETIEFGLRYYNPERQLSADLAVYRIVRENDVSNPASISSDYLFNGPYAEFFDDLNGNGIFDRPRRNSPANEYTGPVESGRFSFPGNELTSQGVDLNINYNPTDSWSFRFSYAYNDTTITESPEGLIDGEELPGNFQDKFTLTARYSFREGPLEGLTLGLNQIYTSPILLDIIREDIGRPNGRNGPELVPDGEGDIIPINGVVPRKWKLRSEAQWLTNIFLTWEGQIPWSSNYFTDPRLRLQMNVNNLFDNRDIGRSGNRLSPQEYVLSASIVF
ncbi:MAG: TonB-dependent receptor [Verrucomicrobiota bacterium]